MNLGKKIRLERKNKGLSQELLAENSRVSLRTIQRIENNASKPRPYTLKLIANALNIEVTELIEEQNSDSKSPTGTDSISKINLINSSALLGCIIPVFNIIAPVIFWKLNKHNLIVNEKGKRVISFQILWFLFSILVLFAVHLINYKITGEFVKGRLPIVVLIYGLLLFVNVFFIIRTSNQLKKGQTEIYPFTPNLF
ncbi:helix-turn-helix domain-containing protein [Flavobacterium sp. HNIBRBA15423]|uniref:helix-turn-helix domain-containing protein n=1 Tax=Flavobacterium sp. HNIBRBA15423 TaxID=3458683 RepID=UPI0040448B03